MRLETIREVVNVARAAERERRRRRREGEEGRERSLLWEAILIKWTHGRTHPPIIHGPIKHVTSSFVFSAIKLLFSPSSNHYLSQHHHQHPHHHHHH